MGKIDSILNAIPPPPNWPVVADTFRDSIVPKLIDDLDNLLGKAPNKPSVPSIPDGIDDKGFIDSTPKGKEAEGLGDTDFSKVKTEAKEIEFKEDDSEGFNILNPIEALPSQDDFLQNIPKDVDNPAPTPPDVGDGKAPIPNDSEGEAPIPDDSSGKAPIPNDSAGNAPMPGDSGGKAPIPNDSGEKAPIPNDNSGKAPIPNNLGEKAPIPRGDT